VIDLFFNNGIAWQLATRILTGAGLSPVTGTSQKDTMEDFD